MFVTCKVLGSMGRLGNQLFQIATTIGYGIRYKKEWVFPCWGYSQYFDLPIKKIETDNDVCEINLRWCDLPYKEGNVNVHGHFLSLDYFNKYQDIIFQTFKLKNESEIKEKYKEILNKKNCSIHVRRNDYLLPEQIHNQGVMGMQYYKKAMKMYDEDTLFVVFSDDIEWCKENFLGKNVIFIEGNNEIIDLFLMSYCQNNIIANSTFSLWGAYLNRNINKKVIAPIRWFYNTDGWDDLYEKQWIRI